MIPRPLAAAIVLAVLPALERPGAAQAAPRECVIVQALAAAVPFVSDAAECAVKTAPASTFKVPHALIALETGVVADPYATVQWDGAKQPFPAWEHAHSLDSSMKASVLWFYRRTASLIGRDRMMEWLSRLRYGSDRFEGELTEFWLNGDLVVSPIEQAEFLSRLVRYELPATRRHVDAVKAAFEMPPGAITNASGTHPFPVAWPTPLVVRAKTGNTTANGERVSWVVGHLESQGRGHLFVARVRGQQLSMQAGTELAMQTLKARQPR